MGLELHGPGERPRRGRRALFWAGSLAVTLGVVLHLPMFVADAMAGRPLMGMPFDAAMVGGMGLILLGTLAALAALWRPAGPWDGAGRAVRLHPPATLRPLHWWLATALVLA